MESTTSAPNHQSHSSLVSVPATRKHWTQAAVVGGVSLIAFLVMAPFADRPLPRFDAFVTAVQVTLVTTNFLTAYLLFCEFKLFYDRAVLALACGYLIVALLCIPHVLSFPGAIASAGLIGGIQTAPWLYFFWHIAFALAAIIYALLKDMPRKHKSVELSSTWPLAFSITAIVGLAAIISWICIEADRFLPAPYKDEINRASLVLFYASMISLSGVIGIIVLCIRRNSILDVWLIVALFAQVLEPINALLLTSARFTLGFYSGRFFSMLTATVVLAALLSGMTTLHRKLARSNDLLERERHSKMMNLETMTAAIAHELRQPLAAIAANGSAVLLLSEKQKPDLLEIHAAARDIVQDSLDASEVLASVRSMFKMTDKEPRSFDVNDVIRGVVRTLQAELAAHSIELYTALANDVPEITGYRNQIHEVVLNLVNNAIEAMAVDVERPRKLWLTMASHQNDQICILIEDSGPGIRPDVMATIFDACVTTKTHGMGLGLPISRMIVDRHGGHISASVKEGGGTRFAIFLPTTYDFS